MDFTSFAFLDGFQIPLPITLACACVCSYLIGQLPFAKHAVRGKPSASTDSERGKRLLDRLAHEIEMFRSDLVAHEASLDEFKQTLSSAKENELSPNELTEDAERAMRAMQRLADEIPNSFRSIRETTSSAVDALTVELNPRDQQSSVQPQAAARLATQSQ